VVTGRLSAADPNIQQVPRDKEFRNVFGGVEGHSWIKADYSQIELRVAAWLAGEATMLEAYRQGEDLHALTAERVLGDRGARQVGKTLNFGLLYGAGAHKLKEIAFQQYGVTMTDKEAVAYREGFFNAYPFIQQWHRDMTYSITKTGKAVSPTGRVRYLPDAQGWDEGLRGAAVREGINHPVQGFASDLMLHSVNAIHARYPKYVVAIVHDEVDLVVPDHQVEEVSMFVKQTMEDTDWLKSFGINLTVPLVADLGVGTHWGEV
jgi:DNA polymerase-1